MQAVIMAGGKGTRLSQITKDEIPKPMVSILGKPLLEWQIEKLKENKITEIILIVGHRKEKILEYFGDGKKFGVSISYIEEQEPLGTAGAFYYLKEKIKEEYFLLVFGDVFFDIDIKRMEEFHREKRAKATLFVHPNTHPFDSDLVVKDREQKILSFHLKTQVRDGWYDNCVNAGFYILSKEVCEKVKQPQKTDLEKEILMQMAENQEGIYAYSSTEYIKDIGTVERMEKTIEEIQSGLIKKRNLKYDQKCIFLDRDGTVNVKNGLVYQEEDFILEDCAIEAIRKINESGMLAIVVTNQPVVARGLCEIEEVEKIHQKMKTLLGNEGVYFDDVIFCPHHPDKGYPEENPIYKVSCSCRKPEIGMLEKCEEKYHIDLKKSWIIGDTTVDIQTGKNGGLRTILVQTGEAGKDGKYEVKADFVCRDLLEAVEKIIKEENKG